MHPNDTAPQRFSTRADRGSDPLQLVTSEVGQEQFAIDILAVQEINRMLNITRVPHAPRWLEGVVNLRGRIIPVIDLRKRFGIAAEPLDADNRIIVVEVDSRTLGFIVDRVNQVLRVDDSIVASTPDLMAGTHGDYVRGVAKLKDSLLILIDLHRLFAASDLSALDRAAA